MNDKILKNALLAEKLYKLNSTEKKEVISELLKNNTQRGLATELGIAHSTIHDWVSGRQNNVGNKIHMSLNHFYRKIVDSTSDDIVDWGRLRMIRDKIEQLLRDHEIEVNKK